jgi:hypothetical protein
MVLANLLHCRQRAAGLMNADVMKSGEILSVTPCELRWPICAGLLAVLFGVSPTFAASPLRAKFRQAKAGLRVDLPETPPQAPAQFNPDPGAWNAPGQPPLGAPADPYDLPLFPPIPEMPPEAARAVPRSLALPRRAVLGLDPVRKTFHYQSYPLGREGLGYLPNARGVPNRWLLPFPHWQRYRDPSTETPYMYDTPLLWHPYRQSTLKGDIPIIGQDIFLNLTAKNFTLIEGRKLPVGSGISGALPNNGEFFGRGEQFFVSNDTSLAFDLFQGETAFKPVHWLIRVNAVYNNNWTRVRENTLLDPDPRGVDFTDGSAPDTSRIQAVPAENGSASPRDGDPGEFTRPVHPGNVFNFLSGQLRPIGDARELVEVDPETQELPEGRKLGKSKGGDGDRSGLRYTKRYRNFFALQEAFAELHFGDISDNYDFVSSRFGIQPFVSDFRGFIFADTNLGARIFGNYDNNRIQYNLAYFNMREKDTYSDLNMIDSRHQQVLIANVFRQDFIWKGYTAQLSTHLNFDDGGIHFDKNTFLTRPQILGTIPVDDRGFLRGHDVKAFYLGWTGDGHIGRLNITHAFYQVLGEDEFNSLAGRRVDINAQMAALELSYDRDWIRFKLSGFYASGDSDPTDRTARGFDTILDNPFFIGGPFSWYVHEGINLGGTGVNLKQRDSLVPNLRTSKTEGQSNFVNPGVFIAGIGSDIEVTPKLKAFLNVNYIWLAETKPVEVALMTDRASHDLGLDASIGFKFRPLLTDNIIVSAGVGFFFPGEGYKEIYRRSTAPVPGFADQDDRGKADRYLYNGFFTLTFLY